MLKPLRFSFRVHVETGKQYKLWEPIHIGVSAKIRTIYFLLQGFGHLPCFCVATKQSQSLVTRTTSIILQDFKLRKWRLKVLFFKPKFNHFVDT